MVGVLHNQAQSAVQVGGIVGTRSQRAWQFGDIHLLDLKGSPAWDRWDRNCYGLEYGWQTTWGVHVKRRASLLGGSRMQEEPNDLWQSLAVSRTVWLFPRLES